MYQRTEDEAVRMAPIPITLGKEEFKIPVLNIDRQSAWRRQMGEELLPIVQAFGQTASTEAEALSLGIASIYLKFPEKIKVLIQAYDQDGVIMPEAWGKSTDEQVVVAFARIMVVAFPFGGQLAALAELVKTA